MDSAIPVRTVRRTVRVAIALVVSQALLCALIGWLTLGRRGSGTAVDELAAPPQVPPPTVTSSYATPSPSATTSAPAPRATTGPAATDADVVTATSTRSTATARPSATAPPAVPDIVLPVVPEPIVSLLPTPTPSRSAVPPQLPGASARPQVPEVPGPVVVGEPCTPEWAWGRTADGTLVRCLRTWHHSLRWKIV